MNLAKGLQRERPSIITRRGKKRSEVKIKGNSFAFTKRLKL
jgi:hypothetical protein